MRILEKNIPVTLELDMQNTFYDNPEVFNILAEILGTDPILKDEVVMIGAHFDSWTFGTGATDDGAGAAVMMEAMRILKALDLQPRRTIRLALWTGEEQGAWARTPTCSGICGIGPSIGKETCPPPSRNLMNSRSISILTRALEKFGEFTSRGTRQWVPFSRRGWDLSRKVE